LHRFAVFTAALTLVLLGAGGLVTSHGVGMAVPDWPNTFGYNMFFFPFSQWVGGVFYEHSHRLIASGVGLCTTILSIWLQGKRARSFLRLTGVAFALIAVGTVFAFPKHRADAFVLAIVGLASLASTLVWPGCEPARTWLRRLGLAAFVAVVVQGILGGLRVVLFKNEIGIFHATLAQLFFALTCALALFTSRWWEERFGSPWAAGSTASGDPRGVGKSCGFSAKLESRIGPSARLSWLCLSATVLILAQLVLGATMRHQHAGLAIPDFPLAYGRFWPAMDSHSVLHYNQQRIEVIDLNPITSFQIGLQMTHRLIASCIFVMIALSAWVARTEPGPNNFARRLTLCWLALVLAQVVLGAATIWSNKAADIATAHVLVGAVSLAVGTCLCIVLKRQGGFIPRSFTPAASKAEASSPLSAQPSAVLGLE
jgi:cytochrome c oxidase assembly protein subunit 15